MFAHLTSGSGRRSASGLRRLSAAVGLSIVVVLVLSVPAYALPVNPRFAIALSPFGNEVVINWEPATSASGTVTYHIYKATSASGTFSEIGASVGLTNCSYVDTGTVSVPNKCLTEYWYKIETEDDTGFDPNGPEYMSLLDGSLASGYTDEGLMSPTTLHPVEPRGLEVTATVTGSTVNSITLTWNPVAPPNISKYAVWRLTSSGTDGVLIGTTTETSTPSFTDTSGLIVEEHYWYRVAAVAVNGSTEETGAKSFEIHIRPMATTEYDIPHSGASPTGDTCLQCHDVHVAALSPILKESDGAGTVVAFCLSCHDGTASRYDILADYESTSTPETRSRHPVDAGEYTGGDLTCTDCHTPHGDPDQAGSHKLLDAYEETGTIEFCLVCHKPDTPDGSTYTTRTYDMTDFRLSAHNTTGVADPPSGTEIKCITCHLAHTSPNEDLLMYTGYRACFNCHSEEGGGGVTTPDIYGLMTANEDIDAHHDVLEHDQDQTGAGRMACQNCHNAHAATETTPVIDPYDPAPWNSYPKTGYTSTATTDEWENSFCFECHDNSLPTSVDTSPWVEAPVWSDPDGDGNSTSDFDNITTNWDTQKHGKGSDTSERIWLDVYDTLWGGNKNPELRCVDCHEAHGTLGIRNLRSDIAHNHAVMVVDLPVGYDPRFWCTGCHIWPILQHNGGSKNNNVFPKDCTAAGDCHGHQDVGTQF